MKLLIKEWTLEDLKEYCASQTCDSCRFLEENEDDYICAFVFSPCHWELKENL